MPKQRELQIWLEGIYSEGVTPVRESWGVEVSELSEASPPVASRSDTDSRSIPSFFIRVMNVVRLIQTRAAAPSRPPIRPSASLRARMI